VKFKPLGLRTPDWPAVSIVFSIVACALKMLHLPVLYCQHIKQIKPELMN